MTNTHACNCGTCLECAGSDPGPGRRGIVAANRTQVALKHHLLNGLASATALAGLTTRADDDPTVALTDAWASSLHVLSFYLERAHTEAYIGTATDIASVRGLAGQVGYSPRPAISASTILTFTTDEFAESPQIVPIRAGSKVQTIPGPEEVPVLFEASQDLEARPIWNKLPAKRWQTIHPGKTDASVRVTETLLAARIGDIIGFIATTGKVPGPNTFELARVAAMESKSTEPAPHYLINLDDPLKVLVRSAACKIAVFSRRASLFGYNATRFLMLDRDVRQRMLRIDLTGENAVTPAHTEWIGLKASVRQSLTALAPFHPSQIIPAEDKTIDLDAIYPEAMVNRYIVLKSPKKEGVFKIVEVAEVSRSDHGISSKVTRLTLDIDVGDYDDYVRDTAVYIQTEELHVAPYPYTTAQPQPDDRTIMLAAPATLPHGRLVVVQGKAVISAKGNNVVSDSTVAEAAMVDSVGVTADGLPFVKFDAALKNRYNPAELVILGNAVRATHGETKTSTATMRPPGSKLPIGEIIGSGDARKANQAFALRQMGLTHIASANPLGYEPAIEVRVDDAIRPREERLYGLPETSRAYALETAADRRTIVRFAGRLRTSDSNISSVYRIGGGTSGNLAAGRLKTPMTMALGLREVTNPLPAEGGVAPEDVATARVNAPIRIISLDRIVSLDDYEAFARAYGGVAKAQATLLWVGQRETVHLTVGGPDGASIEEGSVLHFNLSKAIRDSSQPGRPFKLLSANRVRARAEIGIESDKAFDRKSVEADIGLAIDATFAADMRAFASPLAKSAVLACVQAVPGVIAARMIKLTSIKEPDDTEILGASGALPGDPAQGAEYLTLAGADVTIKEFAA